MADASIAEAVCDVFVAGRAPMKLRGIKQNPVSLEALAPEPRQKEAA